MLDSFDLMAQSLAGSASVAALMRPGSPAIPAEKLENGGAPEEAAAPTTGGGSLLSGEAALAASLAEEDGGDPDDQEAQDPAAEAADGADEADSAEVAQDDEGLDGLTQEEERIVQELRQRDAEVRRHEQAHAAAGGQYAGSPSYEYTTGPDGKRYAIGGEVSIDAGAVPGNPQATIEKMRVVKRAALAPSTPSAQDRRVAAQADQQAAQARVELHQEKAEEAKEAQEAREARQAEPDPTEVTNDGPAEAAKAAGGGENTQPDPDTRQQSASRDTERRPAPAPIDAVALFNVIA